MASDSVHNYLVVQLNDERRTDAACPVIVVVGDVVRQTVALLGVQVQLQDALLAARELDADGIACAVCACVFVCWLFLFSGELISDRGAEDFAPRFAHVCVCVRAHDEDHVGVCHVGVGRIDDGIATKSSQS